jgi:predicted DNA-binding transcriptional regulator YafY
VEDRIGGMSGTSKAPRAAKVQYWRITRIDELIRSGRCPDSSRLARELEVTPRTVKRDIEYLRLYFGAPVEYDSLKKGYCYTAPGFSLPAVSLTEEEHFWLQVAPLFFEQFKRTPVYERVTAIFDKVNRACPRNVSINMERLRDDFSATGEPGTVISREVWDAVFSALTNRKPLVVDYRTPGAAGRQRTISPLHALCQSGEWYLVADTPDGVRTFALSRMSQPRVVAEGTVTVPAGFNVSAYVKNSFGVFRGSRLHKVRIDFSKELAPYIRERVWHRTQVLKERKGGGVELSLTVNHLFDVKRWLLSWGAGAVALAPKELVREMAKEIKAMEKRYRAAPG